MADVEMADAAAADSTKAQTGTKVAKSTGAEASGENKKRFEVKKVMFYI